MRGILLIEDDKDVADVVARHLNRRLNATVQSFGQAKPALDYLKDERARVDLIVCDLGLPDLSGFELIAHVRRGEDTSDLPIIVLTARSGLQDEARAIEVGADEFVEKPVNLKQLERLAQRLLEA